MSESPKGRAWFELNLDNLKHNYKTIKEQLPQNCQIMPVLKANAYGHGLIPIAKELNKIGVKTFCVATVQEGEDLRLAGIVGEILILGYTNPEDFYLLYKYQLTQTVLDFTYAEKLHRFNKKIHVHISIDTGMHRLGERCENIDRILDIFRCENLIIDGLYTHLSASGMTGKEYEDYTRMQIRSFYYVVKRIELEGFICPKIHIQSSYGVFNYPYLNCDYVRIGIALYGQLSNKEDTEKLGNKLKPVLSIKARVSIVKNLKAGEAAGYDLRFIAPHDMKIAALSIGYADGIPRSLSCGKGSVLIAGKKVPIIGIICMDQMIVDVTDIPNVMQNDIAVIIGKCGSEEITAGEVAQNAETITNEIFSRLGNRLNCVIVQYNEIDSKEKMLIPYNQIKPMRSFAAKPRMVYKKSFNL